MQKRENTQKALILHSEVFYSGLQAPLAPHTDKLYEPLSNSEVHRQQVKVISLLFLLICWLGFCFTGLCTSFYVLPRLFITFC